MRQHHIRHQAHIVQRGRQHPPMHSQHPPRFSHRFFKAAGDLCQGADEQVAKGMAVQFCLAVPGKRYWNKLPSRASSSDKGRQAVANIARRQDAQVAPQASRRAAVICHRDNWP
jgi:hypothetical protein